MAENTKQPAPEADTTESVRVRMYRVGFGDFFLLTVPGTNGPAHVLIDCGVHAKPVAGAMDACIADLKATTNGRLSLVIVTHAHADHLSGFATNYDDFLGFDVEKVWLSNRLDPSNQGAAAFLGQLTAVASAIEPHLGARTDEAAVQAAVKVENALGPLNPATGKRGNADALELLRSGFQGKAQVHYYQGGDTADLPSALEGMMTAQILSPSPLDSGGAFSATDNRDAQYLAAAGDAGAIPHATDLEPFEKAWPGRADDYPRSAFDEFDTGLHGEDHTSSGDGEANLRATLATMQPDALLAAADKLDGTLNNQSLVVLFTSQDKKLLFVGDAQWGNWAYWLYEQGATGALPTMTPAATNILSTIDFYKVGHHGSTNATPIPVVAALNTDCVAMVSTATGAYGTPSKHTEVPRTALLAALEARTGNRTVRSDWVGGPGIDPDPAARADMETLPAGFASSDQLFIDYTL
jgi:beta-lactamase superfamily II metal-dependent hydrolase